MIAEEVVSFGSGERMIGILARPDERATVVRRAVLTTNIGMHHRVGPFRLYVDLGRALAREGWWALRFDQLGLGDSATRLNMSRNPAVESQDLIDAMDFLEHHHGITEFAIVALCSGVDAAHIAAVRDARVRAAVFIDGYTYTTPEFFVRRYLLRGLQVGRWKRWLQRRMIRAERPEGVDASSLPSLFDRKYPARDQFRQDMHALASRGVRSLFIFTGTVDQHFNAERQMFEMLGSEVPRSNTTVKRLAHADHVFTSPTVRADIIQYIRTWITTPAALQVR